MPVNVGSVVFCAFSLNKTGIAGPAHKLLLSLRSSCVLSVFTVGDMWKEISIFPSLLQFADDDIETGAHAIRAMYSIWRD